MKFIAYIYIPFYPEIDEKSGIGAKIEAGKHLHAVFLLTVEQRHWRHDVGDVQSDCRAPWFIFTSLKHDVAWLNAIILEISVFKIFIWGLISSFYGRKFCLKTMR